MAAARRRHCISRVPLSGGLSPPLTTPGPHSRPAAVSVELKQLRQSCTDTLDEYYASQSHQKRALYGGLGELRREAAAVLGTKTSINIAAVDDHGGRTFLSEETAINLLQVLCAVHTHTHARTHAHTHTHTHAHTHTHTHLHTYIHEL